MSHEHFIAAEILYHVRRGIPAHDFNVTSLLEEKSRSLSHPNISDALRKKWLPNSRGASP